MKTVNKHISEIRPYENNPRINDGAVAYVKNSIQRFGFLQPIVIDTDGVIVAGHTRYKAAQQLGLETVPCVVADSLTEEEIKAYRLADNKTAEFANWDLELLDIEMEGLHLDMSDFGFTIEDFEPSEDTFDDFKEFGEDIETAHKCPRCGYEWN